MASLDLPLECTDCHAAFQFSAGEQTFFARRGLRTAPRRCARCRARRRARHAGIPGHPRGSVAPSAVTVPSGVREQNEVVCSACGAPAWVPFRPAPGRPIYCDACYAARHAQGSGLEEVR